MVNSEVVIVTTSSVKSKKQSTKVEEVTCMSMSILPLLWKLITWNMKEMLQNKNKKLARNVFSSWIQLVLDCWI